MRKYLVIFEFNHRGGSTDTFTQQVECHPSMLVARLEQMRTNASRKRGNNSIRVRQVIPL